MKDSVDLMPARISSLVEPHLAKQDKREKQERDEIGDRD